MEKVEKKGLKAETVYEIIKQKIISHEYKQMDPLSERKLSQTLEVSRTPVHIAMQQLQKDKFVNFTMEFGSYVAPITYELIQEVYEIREVLEGLTASLCAKSLNEHERKSLLEIFERFSHALRSSDFEETTKQDIKYHSYIISNCRNKMLMDMLHTVFEHSQRITKLIDYSSSWVEEVLVQHKNITDAIFAGNDVDAEFYMREHIRSSKNRHLSQITR